MHKKLLAMILACAMVIGLASCGKSVDNAGSATSTPAASTAAEPAADGAMKVGFVYIGDDSEAYTANFIAAEKAIKETYGDKVETIAKYNVAEDAVEDPLVELCEAGCKVIFTTSFGYGEKAKELAAQYPDIQFCQATCANADKDTANYHTYMGAIYQGRYVAGIVAGMKMKELIDAGTITADKAKIGYVAAYPYAEVISGYTAFLMGVRSIVPEAKMEVNYTNSWGDYDTEKSMATAMIEDGCVIISQHSDNTTPATVAQQNGVFHVGYNNDMTGIAPEASLISSRIDWSVYFEYVFDCLVNGETIAKDWTAGMKDGAVVVTELNEAIAAEGTAEKIAEVEAGLADGSIHVFQGPWKGEGTAYGADAPDTKEMPADDWFKESDIEGGQTSAPYFYWIIEGITSEN